ncbi:hypothetical protein ScPMuIL_003948 [Solemya velum]
MQLFRILKQVSCCCLYSHLAYLSPAWPKLLGCLDEAVRMDPEALEQAVMDKAYMAHLSRYSTCGGTREETSSMRCSLQSGPNQRKILMLRWHQKRKYLKFGQ